MPHPLYPQSNVSKFTGYDPDKYAFDEVSPTVITDEALTPGRPPTLTQRTIGKFLQPLTRQLVEIPPRPTIDELPDEVIDNMVQRDKAFWVDKPGSNAYTLHDAYYDYSMTSEKLLPTRQSVFPRSYQYDLDCIKYRRVHACDGLKQGSEGKVQKSLAAHCKQCDNDRKKQLLEENAASPNSEQKRWRYYPDVTAALSPEEVLRMMDEYDHL